MNEAPQKRQTAYVVGIDDIKRTPYTKSDGEWEPNYLLINGIKVSRVNIMGVVISSENQNSFIIDDGSTNIMIRQFEGDLPPLELGDVIMVIGRPREFNDDKYIVPEIIKKIDKAWMEVRKISLSRRIPVETPAPVIPAPTPVVETVEEDIADDSQNDLQTVLNSIKMLDTGTGADIDLVIEKSSVSDVEKIITSLMNEGEIFEVKPGRFKVLE